jgi:hypothetical protein
MAVFFQPEWAIDIEAALLIWVTHEGSPVCQLYESRNPIPQFVQLFIPKILEFLYIQVAVPPLCQR